MDNLLTPDLQIDHCLLMLILTSVSGVELARIPCFVNSNIQYLMC